MTLKRFALLLGATVCAGWVTAGAAVACAICFSGKVNAPGEKIDAADVVVMAVPAQAAGAYVVKEVLKGDLPTGTVVVDVIAARDAPGVSGDRILLVRNRPSQQWSSLGSIGRGEASWLKGLASVDTKPAKPAWPPDFLATTGLTEAQWRERLALIAPELESSDRLSAAIAYGELARAPYALLRTLKGKRPPGEIEAWVADPALAARQPAYTLLLGVVGDAPERKVVETQLASRADAHEAANLAALIAAALELSGPSRLEWIEDTYLADKRRSLPEIEAALLALSVQGTADRTIPRASIVSAYRRFIRARPQMAAFVAQDLSDWQAVEAVDDMEAAIRSGAIKDPGSQFAVLSYLKGVAVGPRPSRTESDLPL
jgi:hypothetical protein